jgi:hypothetical protein
MLPETRNVKKQVKRNQQNIEDINDRDNPLFRRISETALTSGADVTGSTNGISRRAKCTADAGGGSTIICDLFGYEDGVLATSGDEFNVTVHCNIADTSALNLALPRLQENLIITVAFHALTSTTGQWECTALFQKSKDCVCL